MYGRVLRLKFLRRTLKFRQSSSIVKLSNSPKLLLASTLEAALVKENLKETIKDIDLSLKQACEFGEDAIAELMDVLKTEITQIAIDYKECLIKQVDIISQASSSGHFAGRWEDLPEYRSLAVELKQELENITTSLNTIGLLVQSENFKFVTLDEGLLISIDEKCKELQKVLEEHVGEIKKLETKVLEAQRKSILNA